MEKGRGRIVANACDADDAPLIHVEFFGLARERAGVVRCELRASRLSGLLQEIERIYARFKGSLTGVLLGDSLFRVSLNGERFLVEDEVLPPGAKVLILSGDAGG